MTTRGRRTLRGAMYATLIAAGALYVVWPSPSLSNALDWKTYVWSTFLVTGGSFGVYSCITRRWLGEYIGLPLLVSAFVVFGVANIAGFGGNQARLILGLVLMAFAFALQTRWQEISTLSRSGRQKK